MFSSYSHKLQRHLKGGINVVRTAGNNPLSRKDNFGIMTLLAVVAQFVGNAEVQQTGVAQRYESITADVNS